MYQTCPKCGYTRAPEDNTATDRCPSCGLIYRKWFNSRFHSGTRPDSIDDTGSSLSRRQIIDYLLFTRPEQNPAILYFHGLVLLLLLAWSVNFFSMNYYYYIEDTRIDSATPEIYSSFLHNVNLVFHEAGHVLFSPFGRFLTQLGGSLLQLIVPLVVMLVFLVKEHNTFAAATGLWWLGQNLMDLAPYINDARNMQIPLLGGGSGSDRPGIHDWNNILSSLGLLNHEHALAGFAQGLGMLIMLISLGWAGLVILHAYRKRI